MSNSVYCIADDVQAKTIVDNLKASGFSGDDISILTRSDIYRHDIHDHVSRAPEGAAVGVVSGAAIGGIAGIVAGIGTLAIPGVGPLIAAGPILAALGGAALGGTLGGVTGLLVGAGIPEADAARYEGRLKDGYTLVSVHSENAAQTQMLKEVFENAGVHEISTSSHLTT